MKRANGIVAKAEATSSVAFRLPISLIQKLDRQVHRARSTRKQVILDLITAEVETDSIALACLTHLVRLHHRLDRGSQLDDELRREIIEAVHLTAELAKRELAT